MCLETHTMNLAVSYQDFTSNLTMKFWPSLLVQWARIPVSCFCSWIEEKWTSCFKKKHGSWLAWFRSYPTGFIPINSYQTVNECTYNNKLSFIIFLVQSFIFEYSVEHKMVWIKHLWYILSYDEMQKLLSLTRCVLSAECIVI